ncbi:hypothetical protein NUKP84_17480 [Klebsiella variicola]|nr:hypothetical protein NUKP84_17480 [Klebsiella variicola]
MLTVGEDDRAGQYGCRQQSRQENKRGQFHESGLRQTESSDSVPVAAHKNPNKLKSRTQKFFYHLMNVRSTE